MIYFLRHGLDDERYIGGWSDVDLIPQGIKQIENTLEKIKEQNIVVKRIISSDVKRAITTANMVSTSLGVADVSVSKMFREQNKGVLNGYDKEAAKKEYPDYFDKVNIDTIYPEGESLRNLYERIRNELPNILSLEDDTLIVTHRGVINMLYYILNNIELDMDKEKFGVSHASLHELDNRKLKIRKVI